MLRTLFTVSACVANLLSATPVFADDTALLLVNEAWRTDRIAAGADRGAVAARIAADFPGIFGTPEQTRARIVELRGGEVQHRAKGDLGYGEIYISLVLAQALAKSSSMQGDEALNRILARRAEGKGWERIAHDLALKLGPVLARAHSGNDRLAKAFDPVEGQPKTGQPERAGKS